MMGNHNLTLGRFLPYRLSFTSNAVSEGVAGSYETMFGLAIPEWRLIAVCAEHDGITQQQIGRKTRMDKVTVSRAAIALAERNLLARLPNPADRRSHLLVLTRTGRELYGQVAPKALELEQRIFGQFSREEMTLLMGLLDRIDTAAITAIEGRPHAA